MMKRFIVLAMLFSINGIAQPQITWQKYYDSGSVINVCLSIEQRKDSGFLGSVWTYNGVNYAALFRVNKYGDTLWTKRFNVIGHLFHVTNNTFLLGGSELGVGCIHMINENGDSLWTKYDPQFTSLSVATSPDSGYILYSNNFVNKTDSLGNILWSHNIGASIYKAISCKNGDVLVMGKYSNGPDQYFAYLYDSAGTLLWNRTYGNWYISWGQSSFGGILDAVELPDGNFMAPCIAQSGFTNPGGDWDLMMIERVTGDTLMTRRYTPSGSFGGPNGTICYSKDSNLIVTLDAALMKIDTLGNLIWSKCTTLEIVDAIGCSDGGIAIAGYYATGPSLSYSTYAKLDSLGNIYNFQSVPELAVNELRVYPNPASHQLTINHLQLTIGNPVTVTVYDVMGKVHLQQTQTAQGDVKVELNTLPSGMYVLQLQQADRLFTGRFVKE